MIVVPDDFPSVFEGTPAHERAKKLGDLAVFTERGADAEQELIRRIGRAQVAINIRAHARFSEAVFAACPNLKMVSVWGTGTDNVDLNTAGMRGVTVCNTPGINAFAVAEHALTLMLAVARKITILDTVSSLAGIDVRTDEWGVDLNMTGSQKCLAAPLGMAIVGVTPPAWEAMERRKNKASSWGYDLLRWRDSWIPAARGGRVPDGGRRMQPISMPTQMTHALGTAVRLVLEEGLDARFRRHAVAGRAFRAGIEAMRLEMFPDKSVLSDTVSCLKTPPGIESAAVVSHMRQTHGILIGTGLDKMRATTLRVGHMGITASPLYVLPTLSALEMTLRALGYRSEAGAGVAAAQAIFADAA